VKLGEALTLRSQLQTRFRELSERVKASVFTQEGEAPPEDPVALLKELERVAAELEQLVAAINKTNLATTLRDGRTLTDALARRDHLTVLQMSFQRVADAASEAQVRYGRTEIKLVRTIDVAAMRRRIDELAKERRELDAQIQEANWQTELAT
jgi:reverse gyrase